MDDLIALISPFQKKNIRYLLFRVLFVRAGTQSGALSSSMTSNSFRNFIVLTQIFTAFNLITYCIQIFTKSGSEKSSFLLYQACYQPEGVKIQSL